MDISQDLRQLSAKKTMIFEPFYNKVQFMKCLNQRKSVFHYQGKEYKELQDQFLRISSYIKERLM